MYDRFKNQYIFKLSNGKAINFFYKESTGLSASTLNKRNMWTESALLVKDCKRGFSADIDENDKIHILFEDSKGNLLTLQYTESGYQTRPLPESISCSDKNLTVIAADNEIYYFYVAEQDGNKHLYYRNSLEDFTFSEPKVIDYSTASILPYFAFRDTTGFITVFYISADDGHRSLGFKKINEQDSSISDFTSISDLSDDAYILGGLCDSSGTYHFLWDRKKEEKYELCCVNKSPESDDFKDEEIIDISALPHTHSAIIEKNSDIICYWVTDNTIYYSLYSINKHFTNPEKYRYFDGRSFYCITYKLNPVDRNKKIDSFSVPANFSSGYKLAFPEAFPQGMSVVRTSDKPSEPTRESIDEFNQKYIMLNDKIIDLENRVRQIELLQQVKTENIKSDEKINLDQEVETTIQQASDNISNIMSSEGLESNSDNDSLNKDPEIIKSAPSYSNIPVMPGKGFSYITPQYLKSLRNKN